MILFLPAASLFLMLMLHIEPNFGALGPLLNNPNPHTPNVVGSLVALGLFLLAIVAFTMNLGFVVRILRAGQSITAYPINLVVTIATLSLIVAVISSIIIDQYPCWIGVPNCD